MVVAQVGGWAVACRSAGFEWEQNEPDLVALRLHGLTYAQLASEAGVSAQQAWLALKERLNGSAPSNGMERFAVRWGPVLEMEFLTARSSRVAAQAVGVSERLARRHLHVVGLSHLDLPAVQSGVAGWGDEEMLALLRKFVDEDGEPATLGRLAAWADRTGCRVPSYRTWIVRFGSWREACEAAGVPSGEPTREFSGAVGEETCLSAVAEFLEWCLGDGVRPTLTRYEQMSPGRGWPCRNTVLLRLGSWREAVEAADSVSVDA